MPYAVIACSIAFFWVISLRAVLFTVLPTIAVELGMSAGAAGALIGLTSLGYTSVVWAAGFLPGRRKRVMQIGIAVSLLAFIGVALSPWPVALYATAILAGAGSGVYLPLGLAIIVGASPAGQRSRNMSVHEVMATAGYFCGAGFVAVGLAVMTWRQATLAWCIFGVIGWVALLFMRDDPLVRPAPGAKGALPLDITLVASVVIFGACQVLISGLASVLPLVMVQGWGVSQAEAAAVTSWSRLSGLVGIAIAGAFGDRWQPAATVRGFLAFAALATAGMFLLPYGPLFIAAVFSLSTASSGAIILVSVVVAQAFPVEARGRALSLTNGFGGVIALAVLPTLFGGLIEQGLTTAPFLVALVCALLAAGLIDYVTQRQVHLAVPEVSE
ncbi:MAG: MFS transporter [Chloroflexota bacterium]